MDRQNEVLRRVCMLEEGEAKGHGIFIDRKTLETALACASKFSEGLKVKLRHSISGAYQNILEEAFGLLKDPAIEGNKLCADLYLLKSLPASIKEKAFEMAEAMASQFGLSIDFAGTKEMIDGKPYLRCTNLNSTDLTDKPAATSGLFSMKETEAKYENGKDGKHAKDCACGECEGKKTSSKMESLSATLEALVKTVNTLAEKVNAAPAPAAVGKLEYKDATGATKTLEVSSIVAQLEASEKLVADTKKAMESSQVQAIIGKLQSECRVVYKDDGVAYKTDELAALPLDFLKFAAKNSQVLPTVARATYSGTGGGPKADEVFTKMTYKDGKRVEVPLNGIELAAAEMAQQFESLDKAIAKQNGNLSN